jgi:hypothetical protein
MKFRVFWDVLPCSQVDVNFKKETLKYIIITINNNNNVKKILF